MSADQEVLAATGGPTIIGLVVGGIVALVAGGTALAISAWRGIAKRSAAK